MNQSILKMHEGKAVISEIFCKCKKGSYVCNSYQSPPVSECLLFDKFEPLTCFYGHYKNPVSKDLS